MKLYRTLGITFALLLVLAPRSLAQEERASDPVPEIEPRFEQLFWSDSLRLWGVGLFGRPGGVSLSPDGRWLALSAFEEADRVNLWLASVDPKEAVRLTDGEYLDQDPAWFPDGTAIAFSSSRPTAPSQDRLKPMRIFVSPEGAGPDGPPRQIGLEGSTEFAISPDGRSFAYATGGQGGGTLKIIPATGGNPRTVATGGTVLMPRWGPDGRFLYFLQHVAADQNWAVLKVPVEGGETETLWWDPPWGINLSPEGQYLYREIPSREGDSTLYEIATVEGEPLARFRLPEEYVLLDFAGKPNQLLAARQDIVNPLRVLPVFGGPALQLNDQWGYDVPLAWTADGSEILFRTELNGEGIFMLAPMDGGTMRQVPLPKSMDPEGWPFLSADGGHVFFLEAAEDEDHRNLWEYAVGDGSVRKVDEGLHPYERTPGFGHKGAGIGSNPFRSGGGVGYWVTRNGNHELRTVRPTGSPETLWTFPAEDDNPPPFSVHGSRIAFTECDRQQQECSLLLAEGGAGQAKKLLSRQAILSWLNRPVWSPDGRYLAVEESQPDGDGLDVLLVEVSASGDLVGEPRVLPMEGGPRFWWSLQWVPGGDHFLVSGMASEAIMDTEVWLVSTDPDTPPVPVTTDLNESVWNFSLSPDGRHITIESDMPRGASIWRIDLGDVLRSPGNHLHPPSPLSPSTGTSKTPGGGNG